MKNPRWVKWLFRIAGLYGVLVMPPQFFMEKGFGQKLPPPITHPEFYYGFLGVGFAFQILFFIIAQDPVRYRLTIIPSILEKASFAIAVFVLLSLSRAPSCMAGAAVIDATFGALFLLAFLKLPKNV